MMWSMPGWPNSTSHAEWLKAASGMRLMPAASASAMKFWKAAMEVARLAALFTLVWTVGLPEKAALMRGSTSQKFFLA